MFQLRYFGILPRTALTLIFVALAHLATAATNTVTSTGDDGSPGTLRHATQISGPGDTIVFAPGLSGATILLTNYSVLAGHTNAALNVGGAAIDASSLPGGIQINGNQLDCIFIVYGGTNVLTGLTLTNGFARFGSGSVDNSFGDGGGILNFWFGTVILNRCIVAGNSSYPNVGSSQGGNGGGGLANYGRMTLNECTIAGNSCVGGPGGIYNDGIMTLNNSTLSGNSIFQGNVVCAGFCPNPNARLTLNQCTMSGGGVSTVEIVRARSGAEIGRRAPVFVNQSTIGGGLSGNFIVSNSIVTGTLSQYTTLTNSGNNVFATNANLSPLGNYGGLTQTMPPLPGSPAIDNADDVITNFFVIDQRGSPRLSGLHVDCGAVESAFAPGAPLAVTQPATGIGPTVGTLNGTVTQNGATTTCYFQFGTTTNYGTNIFLATPNTGTASISNNLTGLSPGTIYHFRVVASNSLGAAFGDNVSFQTGTERIVTNTNDSGPGSLRDVVASFAPGDSISFATNLSGQTILLTSGQITISNSLTLDASPLPAGLTIDGNTNGRIFQIPISNTVALYSLTITNGKVIGDGGGGIHNAGTLALNTGRVAGNTASGNGGGIFNAGALTLNNCTVAGNTTSSNSGGGIWNGGMTTLNKCTVTENAAANSGGGIFADGYVIANQSTICSNSASYGGGIYVNTSAFVKQSTVSGNYATNWGSGIFKPWPRWLMVFNSIVAGNTGPGPNVYWDALSFPTYEPIYSGGNIISGDPMLAPLGNYGGPTLTMPPLLGSPAIDNGSNSATNEFTSDQRDLPRLLGASVDIGSVESSYPPAAPLVVTQPATGIDTTVATLNATVAPNGAVTTFYFQYGTTTNYGIATTNVTLAAGPTSRSHSLTGLSPATTYHFRAVATNNVGTVFGDDLSFQTRNPIHVVTNTNDSGPGSLRDAIGTFFAGDTVVFANNLSGQTIQLTSGQINLNTTLTLDASTLPGGLIINGNTNGRIFQVASGISVLLDSLTITNGKVTGDGGGINNSGTLTLNNCTVAGNAASTNGGGIYDHSSGTTLALNNCTVAGNSASFDGGGIYNWGGALALNQSTLSGNTANMGGGLYLYSSSTLVNQSTLSGNYATNGGGGIQLFYSGNPLTLSNSIVAGNTGSPGPDIRDSGFSTPVTFLGGNLTNGNPLLSPLGNYGGLTQTMPPLQDSPAIDGCSKGTGFTNDQRGFARVSGLYADIGAAESSFPITTPLVVTQPAIVLGSNSATLNGVVIPHGAATTAAFQFGLTTGYGAASPDFHLTSGSSISYTATGLLPRTTYHFRAIANNILGGSVGGDLTFLTGGFTNLVSNTNDNGPGSLREAVANYIAGDNIAFATNLAGKAILLTNGPIILDKSLAIDASPIPGGIAIDGNQNGRVFQVTNSTNIIVVLDSLTITNGKVIGDFGGGVYNGGKLTLNRCTVAGNATSFDGGGIYNVGILTVSTSTVAGNTASTNGGGIYNYGQLILGQSTLSGNSASSGGGLYNAGGLGVLGSRINQSTFAGNSADAGGGIYLYYVVLMDQCTVSANYATNGGGGLYNGSASFPRATNSIFTGNFGPSDFLWLGSTQVLAQWSYNLTNGNPMLAPLGNYGGPTQTMPPLPGSPAIDGCTGGTHFTTDQRGFPRQVDGNGDNWVGADIGAAESAVGNLTGVKKLGNGMFQFGFLNYGALSYTVLASTNLASPLDTWSNLGPALETPPGSGQYQFTDPQATTNYPQRFYRVRSP